MTRPCNSFAHRRLQSENDRLRAENDRLRNDLSGIVQGILTYAAAEQPAPSPVAPAYIAPGDIIGLGDRDARIITINYETRAIRFEYLSGGAE